MMTIFRAAAAVLLWVLPARAAQHKVLPKETLWGLAASSYGKPLRWRDILAANPTLKDPDRIFPGQMLEIPDLKEEPSPAQEAGAPSGGPVEPLALAAAPVAAEAAPEPETAPAEDAPSRPEAQPKAAAPAPKDKVNGTLGEVVFADPPNAGLSGSMPPRLTEGSASGPRFKAPRGWRPDGEIVEAQGLPLFAVAGDAVLARMSARVTVAAGEVLTVYRFSTAVDSDSDQKARYLQRVGSVRFVLGCPGASCRGVVVRSGGAVQAGDWLKREKS